MKYNIFSTFTLFLGRFFTNPDFSKWDPDLWPIRIRTQKKKSDPDPGKKPGSETLSTKRPALVVQYSPLKF